MLTYKVASVAAVAGLSAALAAGSPEPKTAGLSVSIPIEQLRFYKNQDGLTFANAWGDPATGPHSNYIKLPANYAGSLHVHTSNYYGVVVRGVVSNERRAQADRSLLPGSYWFQKGGEPHVTKCLSQVECLIFVTSHGAFDIHPVNVPSRQDGVAEPRQ